jgi:hypothetical protein
VTIKEAVKYRSVFVILGANEIYFWVDNFSPMSNLSAIGSVGKIRYAESVRE